MADYTGLVRAMKQAGVSAVSAEKPVSICFGNVISESPLKVQIDQKLTLSAAQLVLTESVTDHDVEMTINGSAKQTYTIHNNLSVGDEVVLLRQQGGQKYIVIDKVVKA